LLPLLGLIIYYDSIIDGGIPPQKTADCNEQDSVSAQGHKETGPNVRWREHFIIVILCFINAQIMLISWGSVYKILQNYK